MSPRKDKSPDPPSPAAAKSEEPSPVDNYKPTPKEKAAIEKFKQRLQKSSPAPRVGVASKDGARQLLVGHSEEGLGFMLLAEALGTTDQDFVNGMLGQLANAAKPGGAAAEAEVNFLLSVIKDIKPRDQLESMLAAQMAVTHRAVMTFATRLGKVENIQQQDSAVNAMTKLTRTYAAQLEALKRHRTGGEQKVTVQHVNVRDGGQAILGNVTAQSARGPAPEQVKPTALALTHSKETPMAMVNDKNAQPVTAQPRSKNGRRPPT